MPSGGAALFFYDYSSFWIFQELNSHILVFPYLRNSILIYIHQEEYLVYFMCYAFYNA